MSQPSGTRRYRCPFCGEMYTRTNWMIRRGIKNAEGKLLLDTHQIGCYSRQQRKKLVSGRGGQPGPLPERKKQHEA